MLNSGTRELPQAKSYSSIYNLIGASEYKRYFKSHKRSVRLKEDLSPFYIQTGDVSERKPKSKDNSEILNEKSYVTSERYHCLNKKSSDKSVLRSTSTFFYDLDSLAKRHSYNCIPDPSEPNNVTAKPSDIINSGFIVKSEAIVQECATQIKPKLSSKKVKEHKKKNKKAFSNEILSKTRLIDNDENFYKHGHDDNLTDEGTQKYWSYAKYKTEFTNPSDAEKKVKKKDGGKRTEDPCPCQLFSYACPCTNNKSLTELAKNNKSLTLVDETTSIPQFVVQEQKDKKLSKTIKTKNITQENKQTSAINIGEKKSTEFASNECYSCAKSPDYNIINNTKIKSSRKPKVICPNCKTMVDVTSTTEEEGSLKSKSSPLYKSHNTPTTATYTYQDVKEDKSKIVETRDVCNHEPQCDLIPTCQILPTDTSNNHSSIKPNPRVIRITKGCRHHPPCTVVPSCQRLNVLKNNCEYIPPCLHRPRCVNLPLCAPLSKSIYYEDSGMKPEQDCDTPEHFDGLEYLQLHHARYIPSRKHGLKENPINRMQLNTCEYNEPLPKFVANQTLGTPVSYSCQQKPSNNKFYKPEKSCQFDCIDRKQNYINQEEESNGDVIFIRDVGCQFRNKKYSAEESIAPSQTSSGTLNGYKLNVNKFSDNFHTLRCGENSTIPMTGEELSISISGSLSSADIFSQRGSQVKYQSRDGKEMQATGFESKSNKSPFGGNNKVDSYVNFCLSANDNVKKKIGYNEPLLPLPPKILKSQQFFDFSLKSRSSLLKAKYKYSFPNRRRKKSRVANKITS